MTAHRQRRCLHCRIRYFYQVSGGGCFEALNDGNYCPECKQVLIHALRETPVKVKKSWEPTGEVTFEQLKIWEAEDNTLKLFQRILPPLFSTTDPSNNIVKVVRGHGEFEGRWYSYNYWTKAPDEVSITMETETELSTGTQTPWRNLPRG